MIAILQYVSQFKEMLKQDGICLGESMKNISKCSYIRSLYEFSGNGIA